MPKLAFTITSVITPHQILNVIKDNARSWNVKEAYPTTEVPTDTMCRRNVPMMDKIFQKGISTTPLQVIPFRKC